MTGTGTGGGALTVADVLASLMRREELTPEASRWMMEEILSGDATPVQIAGLMVALRTKGETVAEITGIAQAVLDRATPVTVPGRTVDIVGSGGDRAGTVNVSTMSGIVAAGAGARVAKHGNRAASSSCGAADVLEALGVALEPEPSAQARILDEAGICFFFAARYHPSFRHAGVARRELGVATTFNLLGPLTNPARPAAQAVGIADVAMAPLVAEVLAGRGTDGLVFHGGDGLDELTTTTSSRVWLFSGGTLRESDFDPAALGVARATPEDLVGGDPAHNAQVVRDLLAGRPGPVRDIVLLNAAAALLAHAGVDPAAGVAEQLEPHLAAATAAVDDGRAAAVLDRWVAASNA